MLKREVNTFKSMCACWNLIVLYFSIVDPDGKDQVREWGARNPSSQVYLVLLQQNACYVNKLSQ